MLANETNNWQNKQLLLWLSPTYSEFYHHKEHHKHRSMPVPSIVMASEPPLWCAAFYRLFAWQRPTKNQINEMQNICILLFVSCYYAWQVKQINILCLVHAIAIGSCIASCNVAIVKLVSLVPHLLPTTLVPLGPSKSHATIAMWWRQGYPQLLPLHTSPLNLYSFFSSPI